MFAALSGHVGGQILIGQKDDSIGFERFNHGDRIAGGATNIALRFYIGICINISDNRHAGEFSPKGAHILSGNAGGE